MGCFDIVSWLLVKHGAATILVRRFPGLAVINRLTAIRVPVSVTAEPVSVKFTGKTSFDN